jgi:hypothetical protein
MPFQPLRLAVLGQNGGKAMSNPGTIMAMRLAPDLLCEG